VTQYVPDSSRLQQEQWRQLREVMIILTRSLVTTTGYTRTFGSFYYEEVVQVDVQGMMLFIADYECWKEKVRVKQELPLGGESNGEDI